MSDGVCAIQCCLLAFKSCSLLTSSYLSQCHVVHAGSSAGRVNSQNEGFIAATANKNLWIDVLQQGLTPSSRNLSQLVLYSQGLMRCWRYASLL